MGTKRKSDPPFAGCSKSVIRRLLNSFHDRMWIDACHSTCNRSLSDPYVCGGLGKGLFNGETCDFNNRLITPTVIYCVCSVPSGSARLPSNILAEFSCCTLRMQQVLIRPVSRLSFAQSGASSLTVHAYPYWCYYGPSGHTRKLCTTPCWYT